MSKPTTVSKNQPEPVNLEDIKEKARSVFKGPVGATDIKILSMNDPVNYFTPPEHLIARTVKIRLKDIDELDSNEMKPYSFP